MAPNLPSVLYNVMIAGGPSMMSILEASFFNSLKGLVFEVLDESNRATERLILEHLMARIPIVMNAQEAFLIGHTDRKGMCLIAYDARTRYGSFCPLDGNFRLTHLIGRKTLPFHE